MTLEQIEMIAIEQKFPKEKLENIEETVTTLVKQHKAVQALPKGAEIAITAGSRGIANIPLILRAIVSTLQQMGYKPFLVPAMGSHGGATAEGQLQVLHHLGITEESVGAEIRSSMEVKLIGYTEDNIPIYIDKHASEADGIIVVNRVKPHTAFRGRVESGLSKMVTIGLGKRKGASFVHASGAQHMAKNIEAVCRGALKNSRILMGIAIVENSYDETALIASVDRENWFEKEAELLEKAKQMMPSLPLPYIDVLIVEEIGKIFSGTGMDPNIIGRWRIDGVPEPETPHMKRIVVLDLAEQSFGNAQGIGLADFTTEQLVKKMDRHATYTNAMTSTYLQRAMLPFIYETEKEAIEQALRSLGPDADYREVKVVQIPNTLHLDQLIVSKPVVEEMKRKNIPFVEKEAVPWDFDASGKLVHRLSTISHKGVS